MKTSAMLVQAELCSRVSYRQIKNIHEQAVKKLLCFLGGALLLGNVYAQLENSSLYLVNQRIPDLALKKIHNFRDSSAMLSSFGHKLLLLDFWNMHCAACIAMFPKEDSLQRVFNDRFQIILITSDTNSKVHEYLEKWKHTHSKQLSMPVVSEDQVLFRKFKHLYIPHYVWVAPDGQVLAETSDVFVNKKTVEYLWQFILEKEADLKSRHFSEKWFHFPKMK